VFLNQKTKNEARNRLHDVKKKKKESNSKHIYVKITKLACCLGL